MKRFIVPGVRTPFVKANTAYAEKSAIDLSVPVMQAMAKRAKPDFVAWGQVIPAVHASSIARDAWLDAKLDPKVPAFSSTMACSSSMMTAIQAASMLGSGGFHLAMVGGAESMSNLPVGLKPKVGQAVADLVMKDPAAALTFLKNLSAADFDLPIKGWVHRQSGRSMGEHTEDTAQVLQIPRADQDMLALRSHHSASASQDRGFFDGLIVPLGDVKKDAIPRADLTADQLAALKPIFEHSDKGSLTAGNSSVATDGAAGLWVADTTGLQRMGVSKCQTAEIVDWRHSAVDYSQETSSMGSALAIFSLLNEHNLAFDDIAVWEIHEASAAQVLATIQALTDKDYLKAESEIVDRLGDFPMDRLNCNGGSLALGHPFAATGARLLSQATKELVSHPSGSLGVVSIATDDGQAAAMLLRRAYPSNTEL